MVGSGSPLRVCWQRSARFVALAMALLCSAGGPDAALAQPPNEYEVKAAFLYNFARFVQWPPQAFASEDDDLALCVLGDDPFRGVLERAVAGKKVQGHEIAVRHVAHDEARQCHILFASAAGKFRSRVALAAVAGSPVLTVGDDRDFANRGGMIAFRLDGNKVRFIVNTDAAAKAGIEISSQLLKVAANVIATPAIAP
jgi:hypothetical protein